MLRTVPALLQPVTAETAARATSPQRPALGARIPVLPLTRTQEEPPARGRAHINITLLTKTGGGPGGGSVQGETRFYLESINISTHIRTRYLPKC